MTTVQIAYDVSDAVEAKIQARLDEIALRNPNWSGAEFEIERGDFTCIPGSDGTGAVQLLGEITLIIEENT